MSPRSEKSDAGVSLGSRTTAPMRVDEAHKRFGTSNDAELVLALLGAFGAAEEALRRFRQAAEIELARHQCYTSPYAQARFWEQVAERAEAVPEVLDELCQDSLETPLAKIVAADPPLTGHVDTLFVEAYELAVAGVAAEEALRAAHAHLPEQPGKAKRLIAAALSGVDKR